jgi:asparagine synthase (glutamine-hydrolysing)
MKTVSLPPLDSLEMHSGVIVGYRRTPPEPPKEPLHSSGVGGALEELLLPALSRPPCMVAFSGGRDSSVLLAVATEVARRHGLNDPIPLTERFPEHPRTWENEWQEKVVRHLGLSDWEILQIRSELDALGPIARTALLRHGLHWPPNAYGMNVFLRAAGNGSVITGNGGDETFLYLVGRRAKRASTLQILRMNSIRNLATYLPLELLPKGLKARILARRVLRLPWLRRGARRDVRRRFLKYNTKDADETPWDLQDFQDRRYLELARSAFSAYSEDTNTLLCEPFFDPRFHQVVMAATPPEGFPSRNAAFAHFFGDLLPPDSIHRTSKAVFTEVFWGQDSKEFARRWDGSGLDHDLVDPDALRMEWAKPRPDLRSITPLQAAWLHSNGSPTLLKGPS